MAVRKCCIKDGSRLIKFAVQAVGINALPAVRAAPLAITNLKAPKSRKSSGGYCYFYISNESSVDVFFDNLQVRHYRGRILEENHYYAFGLKIAALSSKAYAAPANNYQYQGDYAEFDDDLGWSR